MKLGLLRKATYIYTYTGFVFKISRRSIVKTNGQRELEFSSTSIVVFRVSGRFFVRVAGVVLPVRLPEGGRAPYPLSML